MVNPPWANGNLEEWLYRPVRVIGRPVHRKEMHFPWHRQGYKGALTFVPVVTKEDEDLTMDSREGLIVGIGWMPAYYLAHDNRGRWENTFDMQEFVGIVTRNEELQDNKLKLPNIYDEQLYQIGRGGD